MHLMKPHRGTLIKCKWIWRPLQQQIGILLASSPCRKQCSEDITWWSTMSVEETEEHQTRMRSIWAACVEQVHVFCGIRIGN